MAEVMAKKESRELGSGKKRKARGRSARKPQQAYGFDVEFSSCATRIVMRDVLANNDYDIALFSRVGLHCYNFQQGTNYKFLSWEKYNTRFTSNYDFYITFEAMDPVRNSVVSFQTLFSDVGRVVADTYVIDMWRTFACRLRGGNKALEDEWDVDKVIDQFYTGPMPKWLSDDGLASHNKKYYVVQESELHENDWLHAFMELAFSSKANRGLVASPPLEINKVVVETKEDYIIEAREKLKAENAIFYICYKYKGVSSEGFAGDHQSIVRKTMDGRPGHMSLEVASQITKR
ncbi:hypothetical protein V5N11_002929 [Cardamine amara subsp. amara]|uniref:Protein FAR1-RELATED SEQUENCE n=1 Tax=Cardamine amara subsp. amara TaxID=228776 RepID=A0ABD1BXX0_CARAN